MITGDQRDTAVAIARELGLGDGAITGAELDQIPPDQAAETIEKTSVFARVTAAHKMKIIEALQLHRHVVAMTGDGVNDAPALKKAHIGVAMGQSGTEVAKEAATMVLTDDNFATIVGAVGEGRTIYSNIVKFVRFQLSTNIGALLSMFVASLLGWLPPFSTIQILWINIIMDGPPAMAMGLDPARPEVMLEPPRAVDAEILSWHRLGLIMTFGAIMVAGTLGMLRYGQMRGDGDAYALTMAFTTFVWFQIFNSFNARMERGTVFSARTFSNLPLWSSLAGVAILQTVAVEWGPAQAVFGTVSLSLNDWRLCIGVAAAILVFGELFRAFRAITGGERRSQPRQD
jgi:Ca2+-transporting ATPase